MDRPQRPHMRRGELAPFVLRTFPLVTFVFGRRQPGLPSAPLDSRLRGKDGGLRGINPRTPVIPCGRFASASVRRVLGLRERDGRPRGSPLRFELAAFYEVVEEVGVGYANGDILLGVSWRLIRFHAARSSFSWMEAHSMTRP